MRIFVNEQSHDIPAGTTVAALCQQFKPDADLVIRNGFPLEGDQPLAEDDRLVLIRRGEIPAAEELETLLVARHTPGVHARLKKAHVGIAGVGGLGSSIAVALARCGIGRLTIADFDLVEPSNLNRQQYFIDQLGLPKVVALRDNLARINPYVQVATHHLRLTTDNIPTLFAGVDVMVEAFDRAEQKAMLVETFLGKVADKPLVAASGMAGFGPANTIVSRQVGGRLTLVGDGTSAAAPGQGLMAPRVGIAAHHQANAVLRLLLGADPV
ncbi:sulfur carrier protein ThiS adenylyltransferase ThiF [Desulfuromonas carbonis]|uniref:sulfur carrier protein ThiS adenylyltransferase ThiF n=1 Tax=Desulfuromonas sp. DDH964 TaxID=1823759 RepID=UPI00078C792B|nr:sulfur carrier protein ThiS adenylyltransferase ThiF [Desulfuromonas sp. DDH964]AMV71428.1 thiamin biosynthesis thiocarboxylate synthase [Desulfuromonas sp. DDH964]